MIDIKEILARFENTIENTNSTNYLLYIYFVHCIIICNKII